MLYDCAITGGGISGLALAILLVRKNKKVILFEKENYPFHKVCGEYISNESVPFLENLGVNFDEYKAPKMDQLLISSPAGIAIKRPLQMGGIGLSRYELDNRLYEIALNAGVEIRTEKVYNIANENNKFTLSTTKENIIASTAVGAYGKNSNIDVQLNRNYKAANAKKIFIAVKHHIRADYNRNFVELHNFHGGYCGLSAIENNTVNLSYISRVSNLKKHGSIANMEKMVLSQNPFLNNYFNNAEFIFSKPLTISHLYFGIKQPATDNILMLGDAAGNIAPLSGNGMSIALLSSKLASQAIISYLHGEITLTQMTEKYKSSFYKAFSARIQMAKLVQYLFGHTKTTDFAFKSLKMFPAMIDVMGRKIHGDTF